MILGPEPRAERSAMRNHLQAPPVRRPVTDRVSQPEQEMEEDAVQLELQFKQRALYYSELRPQEASVDMVFTVRD